MRQPVPFRVVVAKPLSGVAMRIQRGKDELLEPAGHTVDELWFDFDIDVDRTDGVNFLGKYAQGPKAARFVYLNSGTYAGQTGTCWSRRAKLSLMEITGSQIQQALSREGSRVQATVPGIGPDGGPICASVKNLKWTVVDK